MKEEYPIRRMMPQWARYLCMAFGALCFIGGVRDFLQSTTPNLDSLLGGVFIGGAWFAFGLCGGLPLINTVNTWHPAASKDEVNHMHLRGLLVMRGRRWLTWASVPYVFVFGVVLVPALGQAGQPGLALFILAIPPAIINFRYMLSPCPRCGYGFFTRSRSRGAFINLRKNCGHCGLSLYAYKVHKK